MRVTDSETGDVVQAVQMMGSFTYTVDGIRIAGKPGWWVVLTAPRGIFSPRRFEARFDRYEDAAA